MITISNLTIKYKDKTIIQDASFQAPRGCVTMITGSSGLGKTSLLSYLSLNKYNEDEKYFIDSKKIDLNDKKLKKNIQRNLMSYVYQDFELLGDYTILENMKIASSLNNQGLTKQRIKEILKEVYLDDLSLNKQVNQLSGGQKCRLSIAMAIAKNTDYIFMDEPSASLDQKNTQKINQIIGELKKQGKGVIIVSHLPEAFDYDSLYEIKDQSIYHSLSSLEDDSTFQIQKKSQIPLIKELIKINQLKIMLFTLIIGCIIGESGKYMNLSKVIYEDYKMDLNQYLQNEALLYDNVSTSYQWFGLNNPKLSEDILEEVQQLDYVDHTYPFHQFTRSTLLNTTYPTILDYGVGIISDSNYKEIEITLNDLVDITGQETHTYNDLIAIDENYEKQYILQYQEDIQEGIYISEEVAEYLKITNINTLSLKMNIAIPIATTYSKLWTDQETIGEDTRTAYDYVITIEYPIKGIITKSNAILLSVHSSATQFYMDYHIMDQIQLETIENSSKYLKQLQLENPTEKIETGFEPLGYFVILNDSKKLDMLEDSIKKISPTLNIDGYNSYQEDNYDSVISTLFKIMLISIILGVMVTVLTIILKAVLLKNDYSKYAYYYVNGIEINQIYSVITILTEILALIISVLFAYLRIKSSAILTLKESGLLYTSILYICLIHIIITLVVCINGKRQLKSCNENRLIKKT